VTDLPSLLKRLTDLLETEGVDHAILGGYAVRSYGIPRPTYDLDVVVGTDHHGVGELLNRLDVAGFSIPESYRGGWVDSVAGMPLVRVEWIDDQGTFEVDLFLAETVFLRQLLVRSRRSDVEGWPLRVVSPEDLVLLKLIADRPRDRIDVADILFTQSPVDERYLRDWGQQLGIGDRVERALAEPQQP
jgi:hypothetical protein